MTLMLLLGAGLMIRSFGELQGVDLGFGPERVLTARLALPDGYDEAEGEWIGFYDQLLARAEAVPDVDAASASLLIPLSGGNWSSRAAPVGESFDGLPPHSYLFNVVSEGYFETVGTPIVEGRGFTVEDHRGSALVTVVDEAMAERFWPGESAVGKQVFLGDLAEGSTLEDPDWVPRTVVGVARSQRHNQVAEPSLIQAHLPYPQSPGPGLELGILLRTAGSPEALAPALRRLVAELDPNVAVRSVRSLESYVEEDLGTTRAMGGLLAFFSAMALVLAAVGIFGVVAYSVRRQTRELGIRMAMGADARRILLVVLRGILGASGVGIALGLGAALLLTRLLGGLLYGVSPSDPATYGLLTLFLLVVAAGAASVPALRAVRVDPTEVLRHE